MTKLLSAGARKRVKFQLTVGPGKAVFVAGTFNKWNATANPLKINRKNGHYETVLSISPGTHEYKFVVNGIWIMDPTCDDWVTNGHGFMQSPFAS
jgi:1,4-alpha-glucan branching enzyme